MSEYHELYDLLAHIHHGEGFNWLAKGNGYSISVEDYRAVCMELLYSIESERITDEYTHDKILSEFEDNMGDRTGLYDEEYPR